VKCRLNLGWRTSQFRTVSVLWVEELSSTTWTSSSAGTDSSISKRKDLNSSARCRRRVVETTSPVATLRAANRSVIPCLT
jgi:hypothetical protein